MFPLRAQEVPWADTCASNASRLKEAGFWRGGNLGEVGDLPRDHGLHPIALGHVVDHPVRVGVRVEIGPLERVAAQVHDVWEPHLHEGLGPLFHRVGALQRQVELVVFLGLSFTLPVS